ncbi:MAG: nucleotidyltransferase domain-containing protein [bacterium]|nr:nucleotidyltransferase domain-containing protein [Candidatus Margulisiibacteriota bacterium]
MTNEEKHLDLITKNIIENDKPQKIILFGSYASGNPTSSSDLDLLIIKDSPLPRHKRSKEIRKRFRGLKVAMDLLVYTPEEINKWKDVPTSFINQILIKGKVLYG